MLESKNAAFFHKFCLHCDSTHKTLLLPPFFLVYNTLSLLQPKVGIFYVHDLFAKMSHICSNFPLYFLNNVKTFPIYFAFVIVHENGAPFWKASKYRKMLYFTRLTLLQQKTETNLFIGVAVNVTRQKKKQKQKKQ